MIEDTERWATATHEMGHIVAGSALGYGLGPATCIPGTRLTGCALAFPLPVDRAEVERALAGIGNAYVQLPAAVVERLNRDCIYLMAGQIAEDLLAGPRPAPELIVGRVEDLPEPTDDETAYLAAAVDDVLAESDDDKVELLCRIAFGSDTASAASWRSLMADQTAALLLRHEERLRWLAMVLAEEGNLSADALTELLQARP